MLQRHKLLTEKFSKIEALFLKRCSSNGVPFSLNVLANSFKCRRCSAGFKKNESRAILQQESCNLLVRFYVVKWRDSASTVPVPVAIAFNNCTFNNVVNIGDLAHHPLRCTRATNERFTDAAKNNALRTFWFGTCSALKTWIAPCHGNFPGIEESLLQQCLSLLCFFHWHLVRCLRVLLCRMCCCRWSTRNRTASVGRTHVSKTD